MVSPKDQETLIYDVKISSVGPGRVSGQDRTHQPSSMDLAMKLHYLRGVYYFSSQAAQTISLKAIKESMFTWLNHLYTTCGRFRRIDGSGQLYIKCNDCGVRLIEAQCVKTIHEWLEMDDHVSLQRKLLVSTQVIGPELGFSPLVLIQVTRFKCGGMSLGLSWAHVLGDAFSAAEYINTWAQVLSGHQIPKTYSAQSYTKNEALASPLEPSNDPFSVKRVGPVGDNWITTTNGKMDAFSLHLNAAQLSHLQSKLCGQNDSEKIPPFETLCAIIWHCVAKVRNGLDPKRVTICKSDLLGREKGILSNGQNVSVVSVDDYPIPEANPKELATLIMNRAVNEQCKIREAVEGDQELADFVLYGANLTFVNWEEADFYGLTLKGHKPVYVNYTIDGVGEEGVVSVLPGPKDNDKGGVGGRIVTMILPENEIMELKAELKREWSMV